MTPWHWPSASWWHRHVVCRPSTLCIVRQCVVHQCVVHPASCVSVSLTSSCRRHCDTMALAICITAVASCRPLSVHVVHHASMCRALSRIMRRVSACHHRHVIHRHVMHRCDAVAMAICVVSLSSCCRVVCAYRPSWVVVVVTLWQWASASRRHHGSPCRGSSSSLCHALWVAMGRQCVSAGAENTRDLPPGYHHLHR